MCLQDRVVADNLECKGLEIRHDQRRVYVDQSEESNGWILLSDSDQSELSSQNAMRGTLLRI